MIETTWIRLVAQVALSTWAIAEIWLLLTYRGSNAPITGVRWGAMGLACFAAWMFASSLSIKNTALFPRENLLWLFALLELGAAVGAWGWLVANLHSRFHFTFGRGAPADITEG